MQMRRSCAVFHQMLVGILATLAEVHDAAAFHSDAARQFLPQRLPWVFVDGDVDGLLVFEVRLHEAVQPREVAGAGGHGDDVLASGGDDGCRVELAFGDDALRGAEDAVHVVGDKLGPFTIMKCFRALRYLVLTSVPFSK